MNIVKLFIVAIVIASYCGFVQAAAPSNAIDKAADPEKIYAAKCSGCHDGPIANAPHRILFPMFGPQTIYQALSKGVMKTQATGLTDEQLKSLAEHLGEGKLSDASSVPVKQCDTGANDANASDNINEDKKGVESWGMTKANTRWVGADTAGLNKEDIAKLKLKWVFSYPDATRARSQPTVVGNTVFVGSQKGTVYALDLQSGCVKWEYKARVEVRTAVVVSDQGKGLNRDLYFGDFDGNVYAVSADTGKEKWLVELPDHDAVTITGTPRVHDGVVYVPLSSREWATAADPAYECCTFRGGVVALDAKDGTRKWVSYTVDEPLSNGMKNAAKGGFKSPSGAPVWNSPTIDIKRNQLYIGTGENYSSPATDTSDAVIAMNLDTGKIAWVYQSTTEDAWNMACFVGGGINCPKENGPDYDIGAPPVLLTLKGGTDIVLVGQKSGEVFGLSPDDGKLLWKKKIGFGGFLGGVHWGMAANNDTLYAALADTSFGEGSDDKRRPGLFSIQAKTGEINWYSRTENRCVPKDKLGCDMGLSAAITATPDAVFAGGLDGYLYAFDRSNGDVIWEFATDNEFESVSGVSAHGGSIESDGPVVVQGHVLVNSGYSFGGRIPGNALLVFSVDGK